MTNGRHPLVNANFLQKSANGITRLSYWTHRVSIIIAMVLMLIIFVDVFFRRLNLAVTGAMDLIEVSFCILCFFCFAYAWIKGDHINVEILLEHLPLKIQKAVRLFTAGIGVFLFACLAYGSFVLAYGSFRFGDVTVDIGIPRGIPQTAMVVGSILFLLQLIISILIELGIIERPKLYQNDQ